MYLNRVGMSIKMDEATVHIPLDTLEGLIKTVVQKQVGELVNISINTVLETGMIHLAVHDNPEEVLNKLKKAQYSMGATDENFILATQLLFDTEKVNHEYYAGGVVTFSIPADDYIKKTFGIE